MGYPKYSNIASLVANLRNDPRHERLLAEGSAGVAVTRAFTRLRADAGMSRAELARRIGRTEEYVEKLESGAYERCSLPALRSFARALGHDVDVEAMLSRIDVPIYSFDVGVEAALDYELQSTADTPFYIEEFVEPEASERGVDASGTYAADDAYKAPTVYAQLIELGALAAKKLLTDAPKAREREKA